MSAAPLLSYFPEQIVFDDVEKFTGHLKSCKPQNIVCVGAHPDDPETGCGGTLAKLAEQGHRVSVLYLTRGEAGIRNGERRRTAAIRTRESVRACRLLYSAPVFANQIDGETVVDPTRSREFAELLASLEPDIVFTHWPIDTHSDHRTAAQLVYQAWQWSAEKFVVVYYEVMTGVQTHHFQPNCFVDISPTWRQKRSAIFTHQSQRPDRFYPYHEEIEKQRGSEANFERAEAFVVVREKLPKPYLPFTL
jgi:LmbE family N-acetylglucosaminyl deacetylase